MKPFGPFVAVLVTTSVVLAACDSSTRQTSNTTTSTAAASTTTDRPITTTAAATTTTTSGPTLRVPPRVTSLAAGKSGGSGEIQLDWLGVPRAGGYRIYRATTPNGPFSRVADWDLASGQIMKVPEVKNLWLPSWTYPPFTTVPGVTPPPHYQYVEYGFPGDTAHGYRAYFRIAGYNAAGQGPLSQIECGAPLDVPQC